MKKIILSLTVIVFICGVIFAGGLHFGMPSAVKSKVKELDEKVRTKKATQTFTLKGKFASANMSSRIKSVISAESVSKVIVFFSNWWNMVSISNGSFSIEVETGSPVGLIFADVNDNYLGYLTLKNGIDSIPLTKISSGVYTVDFQTLTASGTSVEPGHNPIGDELPLTNDEQSVIADNDDLFASVVKNPDVDGDGKIDMLTDRIFRPFIMYGVKAGNFGSNTTPTLKTPAGIDGYRFNFGVWDKYEVNFPTVVYFVGPLGSQLTGQPNDSPPHEFEQSRCYGSPWISTASIPSPGLPPSGEYKVTYGAKTLTFNLADQSSVPSKILLAVPTVTVSGEIVQKISWVYKRGDGSDLTIDPATIMTDILFAIDGTGSPYETYPQQNRIFNSYNLPPSTTESTIPNSQSWSLQWSNVTSIMMAYNDLYGNHVVVSWDK